VDIGRDIGHADEHAERVWKELDQIIQRRHDQRVKANGHRPSEEIYEASVRHHAAQRERERRAEWAAYHRRQAERHRATLTDLVRFHEEAAAKLDMGGAA